MFDLIEQIIANHFGLGRNELLTDRKRDASDARHFLWYVLHSILGYSSESVARRYGVTSRNIMQYSSVIRDGIKHQPFYERHFREIRASLRLLDII